MARCHNAPPTILSTWSLERWLGHIQSLHSRSIDLTLQRVRTVFEQMGLGPLPWAAVSVAGTNGKGSSAALLGAVYAAAGYRVGTYTSPHLVRYNERVRIDGEAAEDAELCGAFRRVEACRRGIPLTYFEFGTLAAFVVFAERGIDVAVLEVGLGGRKDAVNVIDADGALVTSVGIDHVQWLGRTREAIGREKAGIFRTGRPAVCADTDAPASVIEEAARIGSTLWLAGRDFGPRRTGQGWHWWLAPGRGGPRLSYRSLPPPAINGDRQIDNAAGVLALVAALQPRLPVAEPALREGLSTVRLSGRLQVIPGSPLHVLDVSHNLDAVSALRRFLQAQPRYDRTVAVFAALADKPVAELARELRPCIDAWEVAGLAIDRGCSAPQMASWVRAGVGPDALVTAHETIGAAYEAGLVRAGARGRLVVFGSFHTVGDILPRLNLHGWQ